MIGCDLAGTGILNDWDLCRSRDQKGVRQHHRTVSTAFRFTFNHLILPREHGNSSPQHSLTPWARHTISAMTWNRYSLFSCFTPYIGLNLAENPNSSIWQRYSTNRKNTSTNLAVLVWLVAREKARCIKRSVGSRPFNLYPSHLRTCYGTYTNSSLAFWRTATAAMPTAIRYANTTTSCRILTKLYDSSKRH